MQQSCRLSAHPSPHPPTATMTRQKSGHDRKNLSSEVLVVHNADGLVVGILIFRRCPSSLGAAVTPRPAPAHAPASDHHVSVGCSDALFEPPAQWVQTHRPGPQISDPLDRLPYRATSPSPAQNIASTASSPLHSVHDDLPHRQTIAIDLARSVDPVHVRPRS